MKQQEQNLWNRISQVADSMRDTPSWKKGSPVNKRAAAAICVPKYPRNSTTSSSTKTSKPR